MGFVAGFIGQKLRQTGGGGVGGAGAGAGGGGGGGGGGPYRVDYPT